MAHPSAEKVDRLLLAFFAGPEGPESDGLLAELISGHAGPLIKGILRQRLHRSWGKASTDPSTVEDIHGQVVVRLLGRLRDIKACPNGETIGDFLKYVAVTTYRAYYDSLRDSYPQRHRLKSKLRYLLSHRPTLGLWEGEGGVWLCGPAAWRARPRRPWDPRWSPLPHAWHQGRPVDFLISLFESAGAPLELEELVDTVADLCGLLGDPRAAEPFEVESQASRAHPDPVAQAHDRIFLQQLWVEIRRLPLPERRALLLNLRDGRAQNVIGFLPLTGVATMREIAAVLEMPAEELAHLWGKLPLDDQTLARTMDLQRQQVINLRAAARRRLARRMNLGRTGRAKAIVLA